MELLSRETRDGQPIACAYGCTSNPDGTVRAGLLFVRAKAPAVLTFAPLDSPEAFPLELPEDFVDMDEDGWDIEQPLTVIP